MQAHMSRFDDLKISVYESNLALVKHGLVLFTFGNVSGLDRQHSVIAIKPSGVDYARLKPEDMVVLDLDGQVVEGTLRPSSDTKTHLVLYKQFPEIGGVVHTHSTHAVAWAQAGKPIPILGTTHADHLHVDVPCTTLMSDVLIQGDYEESTGLQILESFKGLSPREVEMVLVAGHGPFTWGKTPEKAVYNAVVLEELAAMALLTLQINPQTARLKPALVEKHFNRKHGPDAYYGQQG
jgi:L-ribulose-5-phosphate 4-epimerase